MKQSQPERMVLDDGDGSSHQQSPVRRFPRVGAQFQTRISKSTGPSVRPTPDRMSVNFPFLSEKEVDQRGDLHVNGMSSCSSSSFASGGSKACSHATYDFPLVDTLVVGTRCRARRP